MPKLIRNRALAADEYALAREARSLADVPIDIGAIVPLALWLERRAALVARGDIGVLLAPVDDPAAIAADVTRLPVVAVDFPVFTDGRGLSTARLLRERYGYAGELRAVGDIQRDQLFALSQCGFDAFLLKEGSDPGAAIASFADFDSVYASTAREPQPWFRRRVAGAVDADVAGPR
jgi:uncharacterized protein (DUF934 family)